MGKAMHLDQLTMGVCYYPEILNATKEGVRLRHGLRKHYNYNSSVFRNKTEGKCFLES